MSKYIPAEKLIAEIEFAKSVYSNPNRVVHGIADAFRQDGRAAMCDDILKKIASLQQEWPESIETETTYDTQQYNPKLSVGIDDVARVQFGSHAKIFDKKRKAVFDWEQFKEVAGIFYGFGKRDHSRTVESEMLPDNEFIDNVIQELHELKRRSNIPVNLYDKQDIIDACKAGVEYGCNHPKLGHPMPDSTKLIELWHEDKEKLKEKDFRYDPWRLAYNAFMCGFGRGIAVNKQEQPKDLALTPDDIKLITKINYEVVFKDTTGVKACDVPSEVLRRFNNQRKEE